MGSVQGGRGRMQATLGEERGADATSICAQCQWRGVDEMKVYQLS
jgi:hypothetical protein